MNKKGSFTIEAALLMPFLIFVVLTLMQISFFLYNREAATVIVSQAVLNGVQMEKEGKRTIQNSLQNFLEKETEEKLLFADKISWNVSVSFTKVKVTLSLSQKTIFKQLDCEVTQQMSRINPASLLWEAERWRK